MKGLLMVFLLSFGFIAQSQSYSQPIQESIDLVNGGFRAATSERDYTTVISRFDELSKANGHDWLPLYYAALSREMYKNSRFSPEGLHAQLDSVVEHQLQKVISLADHTEAHILLALHYILQMKNKGVAVLGDIKEPVQEHLQVARGVNPSNPRMLLAEAMYLRYLPQSGTGSNAISPNIRPLLEEAMVGFRASDPASREPFMPTWGLPMAEQLMAEIQ